MSLTSLLVVLAGAGILFGVIGYLIGRLVEHQTAKQTSSYFDAKAGDRTRDDDDIDWPI